MKLNQKEAVYSATMSVLSENSINLEGNIADVMTKELRKDICAIVLEGFSKGEIELRDTNSNREKVTDPKLLTSYVSGLVNNWHRKDSRLNGGTKYVTKNPGSRVSDPQLKALKALAKQFAGTDKAPKIQAEIDKRSAEIAASKVKTVEVDMSQIPEELKAALDL